MIKYNNRAKIEYTEMMSQIDSKYKK